MLFPHLLAVTLFGLVGDNGDVRTATTATPVRAAAIDSATITLRPHNRGAANFGWVAFDERGRLVDKGTAPSETAQAANGAAVTYCAETRGNGWLALVVDVGGGHIKASAHCTRVTVTGKRVSTLGVDDPRQASATPSGK